MHIHAHKLSTTLEEGVAQVSSAPAEIQINNEKRLVEFFVNWLSWIFLLYLAISQDKGI